MVNVQEEEEEEGRCGNIRNSGLQLALECGPRKEGTRCQGDNLLLGLRRFPCQG